jgi:membrane protein YqaA with SNARE-associated domain
MKPWTASLVPRHLLLELGGVGLVAMGVLDSSVIPTPGGQDLLVALLAGAHPERWPYYALMGTAGALLGGGVGYWLGRKGGASALAHTVGEARRERLARSFRRWGVTAVFFTAIMPPPVPIGPVLLAAGAMRQPLGRFVLALGAARALRYTAVAFLAARYGAHVVGLARRHWLELLGGVAAALAVTVAIGLVTRRRRHSAER